MNLKSIRKDLSVSSVIQNFIKAHTRIILFSCITMFLTDTDSHAQVKIGDNPETIHAASLLELESINKVFVPSRVTDSQMNAISNPLEGAVVYNTDWNCLALYSNSNWISLCDNIGEITHSLRTADFNGWYLLDGRPLTSLPAGAQSVASTLGITGNLPDARGRFLKTDNGSPETLLAEGGQDSIVLLQANLPNVTFSGTTSTAGSHTHTASTDSTGNHVHGYTDRGNTTFHTVSGTTNPLADNTSGSYTTDSAGKHAHVVTVNAAGNHTHTVTASSGGSGTPVPTQPKYLVVNTFIFLRD